jgi:hypothetical protein
MLFMILHVLFKALVLLGVVVWLASTSFALTRYVFQLLLFYFVLYFCCMFDVYVCKWCFVCLFVCLLWFAFPIPLCKLSIYGWKFF